MRISAVVLAAGQSIRMGEPKMVLPWGKTTVIGQVCSVLFQAGLEDVLVVTGGAREAVEKALAGMPVRTVYNPEYTRGEMLSSLQIGLSSLTEQTEAALVTLGDQPQIEAWVVAALLREYAASRADLIVPSVRMRRGHPWLVGRHLWQEIQALRPPETLRDFLRSHNSNIHYLPLEAESILLDLDTPQDYRRYTQSG